MPRARPPTLVNKSFKQPRRGVVTQAYIDKLIAEGAGSGALASYVPWLKIGSFPSKGSSNWVPGVKVQRTHQTLSTGEASFLVLMEFNEKVLDIREQYPIVEYKMAYAIAISKNIKPACYPGTSVPYIFTADFMLTIDDGAEGSYLEAYSIKLKKELENLSSARLKRVLEKFEIEREYWSQQGIPYRMVYSEDLPSVKVKNLILLRLYAKLPSSIASTANLDKMMRIFQSMDLSIVNRLPLRRLLKEISGTLFIEYSVVKQLFFYMIWHHYIKVDLDRYVLTMKDPVFFETVIHHASVHSQRGVA